MRRELDELENKSNDSDGLKQKVLLKPVSNHKLKSEIKNNAEHASYNSDDALISARS